MKKTPLFICLRSASHSSPVADGGEPRICASRKPHGAGYPALALASRCAWLLSDRGLIVYALSAPLNFDIGGLSV